MSFDVLGDRCSLGGLLVLGFAPSIFSLFVSFFRLDFRFVMWIFVWALLSELCFSNNNSQMEKKKFEICVYK